MNSANMNDIRKSNCVKLTSLNIRKFFKVSLYFYKTNSNNNYVLLVTRHL